MSRAIGVLLGLVLLVAVVWVAFEAGQNYEERRDMETSVSEAIGELGESVDRGLDRTGDAVERSLEEFGEEAGELFDANTPDAPPDVPPED